MMAFHREQGKAPRYVVFSVAGRLVKTNILLGYHTGSGGSGVVEMYTQPHTKEYLINSFSHMLLWTENSEDKCCSARLYSTIVRHVYSTIVQHVYSTIVFLVINQLSLLTIFNRD